MTLVVIIIIVGVLVSALLIRSCVSSEKLQIWANVATIIAGFATAISLPWAAYTFFESSRLQRELTAINLYREHLQMSVEKPELANRKLAPEEGSAKEIKKDQEMYLWYVGHGLYSLETVVEASPDDEEWKAVAQDFIKTHEEYIGNGNFPCNAYTRRIRLLVNETLGRAVCPKQP
jgi:type II secretory pathway pseudopilin PulG